MQHLIKEQRYTLYTLRNKGFNGVTIAEELGVSPSTVSRELRRNSSKRAKYNPEKANEMASERKERFASNRRFTKSVEKKVRLYIEQEQWSPEEIVGY